MFMQATPKMTYKFVVGSIKNYDEYKYIINIYF